MNLVLAELLKLKKQYEKSKPEHAALEWAVLEAVKAEESAHTLETMNQEITRAKEEER